MNVLMLVFSVVKCGLSKNARVWRKSFQFLGGQRDSGKRSFY